MRHLRNLTIALLGAFLGTVLVAAPPAAAAPSKPNPAWHRVCDPLMPGPWKRVSTMKTCRLVHTPPGQR